MGFFAKIEKAQAGVIQCAVLLAAVVFARIILEYALESGKAIEPPLSLFLFVAYFAVALSCFVLVVWLFSGKPFVSAVRFVTCVSPLMLLSPFLDLLFSSGRGFTLQFALSPRPFADAFLSVCSGCAGVSPGVKVAVVLAVIVSAVYVWWASRSILKAAGALVAIYAFMLFQALYPGYLMAMFGHAYTDVFLYRELVSSYAVFLSLAFFAVVFLGSPRRSAFLGRLRPGQTAHHVVLALFGAFLGSSQWEHPFPGVLLPVAAFVLAVAFAYEAAGWINDLFDRQGDRVSDPTRAKATAFFRPSELSWIAALLLLSALNALAVGYGVAVWVAFAFCLSLAYSIPPLRLRRHFVPASAILAACSVAVLLGAYGIGLIAQENAPSLIPVNLVLLVFGFVFLASPLKDLKDAAGDRKSGFFTLPAWLGVEKARNVSALLAFAGMAWAVWLSGLNPVAGGAIALLGASSLLFVKDFKKAMLCFFLVDFVLLAAIGLHLNGIV